MKLSTHHSTPYFTHMQKITSMSTTRYDLSLE